MKSTTQNGLWKVEFGELGATLKALQDHGVTPGHLARPCQARLRQAGGGVHAPRRSQRLHFLSVAGLGFEPRLKASKASVLPLDDPAMLNIARRILN